MNEILISLAPHDSPTVASSYGQLSVGINQQEMWDVEPTGEDPTLTIQRGC